MREDVHAFGGLHIWVAPSLRQGVFVREALLLRGKPQHHVGAWGATNFLCVNIYTCVCVLYIHIYIHTYNHMYANKYIHTGSR